MKTVKNILLTLCFACFLFGCNDIVPLDQGVDPNVEVTDIHLAFTSLEIKVNGSQYCQFWPLPATAEYSKLQWSSADESVATVNQFGLIKGVRVGTTTLTCAAKSGAVSKTVTVTVL
jgi:hypothetical protein